MATLNKTDSRVAALRAVKTHTVSYDSISGEYFDLSGADPEHIVGARRRTFSEMRQSGLIREGAEPRATTLVELTEDGVNLAEIWGVD